MSLQNILSSDLRRYQRQFILPEVGISGQERLKHARILVVGVGGLGCPALSYLVAAGVGTIKVADADRVDITNLHRQPLFSESSVGRFKVEEATAVLRERNSDVDIIPIASRVDVNNIREILSDIEIVIDGSDNFATKYLLNDACVELGKSLVYGSVLGFEGQVSVFNAPLSSSARGATYRCLFPEPPPAGLVPSCAEAGVLGVLPGVVGSLQATEALKLILQVGVPLTNRILIFDGLSMSFREISFERLDKAEHTIIRSAEYYEALSPSECAEKAPEISVAELKKRISKAENLVLIDVREPEEKKKYDIGGELIPLGVLKENVHRIPRDATVVIYCKSGVRSGRAVAQLRNDFHFTDIFSLKGGVMSWQLEEIDI